MQLIKKIKIMDNSQDFLLESLSRLGMTTLVVDNSGELNFRHVKLRCLWDNSSGTVKRMLQFPRKKHGEL